MSQEDGKTHGEHGERRVVAQEDEAAESSVDDNVGRDQGKVHGAEEEHRASGHGPVGQEPVVNQVVGAQQQHVGKQEFDVLGVPEG